MSGVTSPPSLTQLQNTIQPPSSIGPAMVEVDFEVTPAQQSFTIDLISILKNYPGFIPMSFRLYNAAPSPMQLIFYPTTYNLMTTLDAGEILTDTIPSVIPPTIFTVGINSLMPNTWLRTFKCKIFFFNYPLAPNKDSLWKPYNVFSNYYSLNGGATLFNMTNAHPVLMVKRLYLQFVNTGNLTFSQVFTLVFARLTNDIIQYFITINYAPYYTLPIELDLPDKLALMITAASVITLSPNVGNAYCYGSSSLEMWQLTTC